MTVSPHRLLLFGKVPVPGRAKTRLAPLLGAEGAAALYQAFLDDAIAAARKVRGASLEVWLDPASANQRLQVTSPAGEPHCDADEALDRTISGACFRWQEGPDLGSRLRTAFGRVFQEGAERVVVVGSDHPTLPMEYLESAFEQLADCDLVFGPSRDGGYYLVGISRGAWPASEDVFREIPWSTSRVLEDTRKRVVQLGMTCRELPGWYDVDEPGDLEQLKRDVAPGSRTAVALGKLFSGARP